MIDQKCKDRHVSLRRGERSFSLLETIIAVSLVAVLMVEVSGVHGNSISFNQYGRKILQASYLAKRIMSQIEYNAAIRSPIKDIAIREKDKPFEDAPEFTYSLTVEPLPHSLDLMFKVLSGGLLGGEDGESGGEKEKGGAGAMLQQMKSIIEQSVGEEPIWIAKVEVNWPEGARRGSTELAMIVTDTKRLEESVGKVMDSAPVTPGASGTQNPVNVPPVTGGVPGTGGIPGPPSLPTNPSTGN